MIFDFYIEVGLVSINSTSQVLSLFLFEQVDVIGVTLLLCEVTK